MRVARRWLPVAVAALALAAVHDRAHADARDYPGVLGDGPRLNQARRFDNAHRFNSDQRAIRRPFLVPGIIYAPDTDSAQPPVMYSPPPVIYTPPPTYPPYAPGAYGAPPSAAAPPPPPSAPPEPRVVEFDTGRYELRGDGLGEPYTWVWVPKVPAAPPGPPSAPRPPATIYRFVDERGVTVLTDDPTKVPPKFRALDVTPR